MAPFEKAGILNAGIPHAELKVINGAVQGLLAYEEARGALGNRVAGVV